LEKARRETQSHLVTFGGGRPETSEHWSFFCVEKSFWAGGLAPRRGHGYALEEYAIRRRWLGAPGAWGPRFIEPPEPPVATPLLSPFLSWFLPPGFLAFFPPFPEPSFVSAGPLAVTCPRGP